MEKYEEIKTISTKNLNTNETETKEIKRKYTIKTWSELTPEEKEKEIERNHESIYSCYQDDLYYMFKDELENIKERYKNIDFETVYIDSNSQGAWIDSVKNFKCYYNIDILGETLEIDEIDLHIRKYIEEITENNIFLYEYYIESEKIEKIKNTKKYKKFINEIIKDVNNWIEEINKECKYLIDNEYRYPYNINDPEDLEFLNNFFENEQFVFEEEQ